MTRENTARHWIDGEWVGSARVCDSIDPATGDVIGTYADADAQVGQQAIDAAGRAFERIRRAPARTPPRPRRRPRPKGP
ncbi:hypothetical protein ACWGBV_06940 [Streptomyces sp. NPDC055051]